jgi:acyl-CoA synthetase (AMP-forming)/AMP-acid ligase II
MVPEKIIFVDEMPVNENGKTDKKKLRESYLG